MGLFDTVWFRCPRCGTLRSEQTKAGECSLHDYSLHDAPPAVAASLDGEVFRCCDRLWQIQVATTAQIVPKIDPPPPEEPW